jgi:predicted enzyme related to lactoylglutathione lyase
MIPMPETSYTMVSTGPTGEQGPSEPGYIGGGMTERDEVIRGPVITVDVDDIDATLATVEALGGKTVRPRQAGLPQFVGIFGVSRVRFAWSGAWSGR